jgi:PBSX family phage terminase large subunit
MVRLSELIAKPFYSVHWDIKLNKHTFYDLSGGRGSTKSTFASLEIIKGMVEDAEANAIVFRKVSNTIETSVFEQILWAIDALGLTDKFKPTKSPYKITFIPTGQVILFKGLDKAKKIKSIKVKKGFFKFLWFEELDEFSGEEEIRSVQQSVLRGGRDYKVFRTFNPPRSRLNWANRFVRKPNKRALRMKSTYLEVPQEWLGEQFINDAEDLKETNLLAYNNEYLGEATGTGGEVFENVTLREITDEEAKKFDRIYRGIDWGWYPDPFQYVKVHFDIARRKLYIFDEYRTNKTSNKDAWEHLKKYNGVKNEDLITADSAENKSIGDFQSYGSLTRGAEKGPNSVKEGIKWLQSLKEIVIDPVRCPNAAAEFSEYEYERTASGEVISQYPDINNHCIDAVRYALERVWKRKGK